MARNQGTISKQKFKGGWVKEIIKRSDGRKQDVYVYSPSGIKLRSSKALLEFIRENKTYLKNLDPTEVNFHQQPGKNGASTSKFIQDIEILKLDYGLKEDNGNNNPLLDAKSESYTGKYFFQIFKWAKSIILHTSYSYFFPFILTVIYILAEGLL